MEVNSFTKMAYKEIEQAINNMLGAKFILSQPKISAVLKSITENEILFNLINFCNNDFDYEKEFERAKTIFTDGARFLLPDNKNKLIALVTGILFEFEMKTIDFHKFILAYYPNMEPGLAYQTFCDSVISPYKKAFYGILVEGQTGLVKEDIEVAQPNGHIINDALMGAVQPLLNRLNLVFIENNSITEEERESLITVSNGLLLGIDMRDARIIKAVWLGLKTMTNRFKSTYKLIDEIEKVLRLYLVLQ